MEWSVCWSFWRGAETGRKCGAVDGTGALGCKPFTALNRHRSYWVYHRRNRAAFSVSQSSSSFEKFLQGVET